MGVLPVYPIPQPLGHKPQWYEGPVGLEEWLGIHIFGYPIHGVHLATDGHDYRVAVFAQSNFLLFIVPVYLSMLPMRYYFFLSTFIDNR